MELKDLLKQRSGGKKISPAVHAVSTVGRTVIELNKKWFDMALKKSLATAKQSMTETGGSEVA